MVHSQNKRVSRLWLVRFSVLNLVCLSVLFSLTVDRPKLFLRLSLLNLALTLYLAWRSQSAPDGKRLWLALVLVAAVFWALFNLVAQASGGDLNMCLPNYRGTGLWTRAMEIEPDPTCKGWRLGEEIG